MYWWPWDKKYFKKNKDLNFTKINNLKLQAPNIKKFPLIGLLNKIPAKFSLFETVIVSTNDTLVDMFLSKKIEFKAISKMFFSIIHDKDLQKYMLIVPKNIVDVVKLKKFVQKKIETRYI